jgi:hypothetical protein
MDHQRSILAGMTDYTGVSLENILSDFDGWLKLTTKTIDKLKSYRVRVEQHQKLLENSREILSFINYFINLGKL